MISGSTEPYRKAASLTGTRFMRKADSIKWLFRFTFPPPASELRMQKSGEQPVNRL